MVTIGNFDGVHLGHKKIIDTVIKSAKSKKLKPGVVTFIKDPELIRKKRRVILTTAEEKREILEESGISFIYWLDFLKVKDMEPKEFFDVILVKKLHVKMIVVGEDFKFGKEREGDIFMLKKFARIYGIKVKIIKKLRIESSDVSSTKIRTLLSKGKVETAYKLLGRSYKIEGRVVKGVRVGRRLGVPTLNLKVDDSKILPANGVYAGYVEIDNKKVLSAIYIGTSPTLLKTPLRVEVHVIGEEIHNIRGNVRVGFRNFIRKEKKFNSLEELKKQIKKDLKKIEKLF